jgi:hypothetical protein
MNSKLQAAAWARKSYLLIFKRMIQGFCLLLNPSANNGFI